MISKARTTCRTVECVGEFEIVNFPAACYSDAIQDEKIKGTTYYKIVSEAFLVAGDFRLGIGIDWSLSTKRSQTT